MKSLIQLGGMMVGLVLCASTALSQEQYTMELNGGSVRTNDSGALIKRQLNNNTFYRECIADLAITNKAQLSLVYNVGADFNGDVIEVRRRNGELLCQKLRLLFPTTVSNPDESEIHQRIHVFTMDPGDSIGEGKIVRRTNSKGQTRISGSLIFVLPEDGTNAAQICTATFHTIRRINN